MKSLLGYSMVEHFGLEAQETHSIQYRLGDILRISGDDNFPHDKPTPIRWPPHYGFKHWSEEEKEQHIRKFGEQSPASWPEGTIGYDIMNPLTVETNTYTNRFTNFINSIFRLLNTETINSLNLLKIRPLIALIAVLKNKDKGSKTLPEKVFFFLVDEK